MLSKSTIERQLEHFRSGECGQHTSEENKYWIAALEWVLGDELHRKTWDDLIVSLEKLGEDYAPAASTRIALKAALEHLR